MKFKDSLRAGAMFYFIAVGIVWTIYTGTNLFVSSYLQISGKAKDPRRGISSEGYGHVPKEMKQDKAFQNLPDDRKDAIDMFFFMHGAGTPPFEELSESELRLSQKYMTAPRFPLFDTFAIANGAYLLVPWEKNRTQDPGIEPDPVLG